MKTYLKRLFLLPLAVVVFALLFSRCKLDKSTIKIERFEYLDAYLGEHPENPKLSNTLLGKAYLIHGYKRRNGKKIGKLIDQFVCDSLMPGLYFPENMHLVFYKKTKNTNRENFQTPVVKWKRFKAENEDTLYDYSFFNYKDSIVPSLRFEYGRLLNGESVTKKIKCK